MYGQFSITRSFHGLFLLLFKERSFLKRFYSCSRMVRSGGRRDCEEHIICQIAQTPSSYNQKIAMVLSSTQKTGFAIGLFLTVLLVGLHFAVAATGHIYFKSNNPGVIVSADGTNLTNRNFNTFIAFLIIAASLTFIFAIPLLIALTAEKLTPHTRHIIAVLILMLEFAIAVTVSIVTCQTGQLRMFLYDKLNYGHNSDLDTFYWLAIADSALSFFQVVYLAVICMGTLNEDESYVMISQGGYQNKPATRVLS